MWKRLWPVWCLLVLALPSTAGASDVLDAAPEGSFTVVVIPDTQAYLGRGTHREPDSTAEVTNPIFAAHTRWIVDNLGQQRIAFVSHVGDIVDRNQPGQWAVAHRCMDLLHGAVPYGISVGNHDMTAGGDSSRFQEHFPRARFAEFDWYGGCFEDPEGNPRLSVNNVNSYQLFSACGMDFVFLHLECNAPDNVLAWADDVLGRYANRRALLTTHMGLGPLQQPRKTSDWTSAPQGRMQWLKIHGDRGNTPQQMWDKCFAKHAHLGAIFCGDQSRSQALRQSSPGIHGNTVHELLSDYGSGYLRLYRFLPSQNRIDVITYDPGGDRLCEGTPTVPDRAGHQFTLAYPMSSP